MRKLLALMALLSLITVIFTGCQSQFQPGTYTDDTGRSVTIDEIPERLVSFGPSITEILFALGLGEKVVGVTDYCDYPEAAQEKPKVGSAFSPSLEKIVELEPDLIFTLKHEQLNTELAGADARFMIMSPEDIDGILANIVLIGKITGVENEARKLTDDMSNDISAVEQRLESAAPVRVFFIVDATDPNNPWTAGPGSFIDALINMAGGENVAAGALSGWVKFSLEEIVSSDPEVIIVQSMAGGVPTVSKEVLEEHPAWKEMTALKKGKIFFIDGDLVSRPGPRIVQGLEEMAEIIHPEL